MDANLLIYAHIDTFRQHRWTRDWLDHQLSGPAPVGLPWAALLAFLRVVTNPRILAEPEPIALAWKQVQRWLACDSVWVPQPTDRHAEILDGLLAEPGLKSDLITDLHLAALAIEHGLTLCSADHDFARFPMVRWFNPLLLKGEP